MNTIILEIQLFLAFIFCLSFITKSIHYSATKQTVSLIGMPNFMLTLSTTVLLISELTAAFLLFLFPYYGALLTITLLLVFTYWIVYNMRKGNKNIDCNCFGNILKTPIGWNLILRNTFLLILVSLLFFGESNRTGFAYLDNYRLLFENNIPQLLMFAFVMAMSVLSMYLADAKRKTDARVKHIETLAFGGLPSGARAPAFELADSTGELHSLSGLLKYKKPLLLIWVDPMCTACAHLIPLLLEWHKEEESDTRLVFLSKDDSKYDDLKQQEKVTFLIPENLDIMDEYDVRAFPTVVYLRKNGRIGKPYAMGEERIIHLLESLSNG